MLLEPLLAQLKGSPILRISLALIISLLIINASLDLQASAERQLKRQQQLQATINRNQQYAAEKDWPDRARQVGVVLATAESRLWQSAAPGLAQAVLHDWLQASLKKAAVTKPQVDMSINQSTSNTDSNDLWLIRAKVSFEFKPTNFREWLLAITSGDKQIIIDRLLIKQEPTPRLEAQLVAPFRPQNRANP